MAQKGISNSAVKSYATKSDGVAGRFCWPISDNYSSTMPQARENTASSLHRNAIFPSEIHNLRPSLDNLRPASIFVVDARKDRRRGAAPCTGEAAGRDVLVFSPLLEQKPP